MSLLKYSELARYLTKSPQTFSTAMWLINAHSYRLEWFSDSDKAPPYAVLSHTWGDDELTFQDIQDPAAPEKPTFAKVRVTCAQALADELGYAWVDTCIVHLQVSCSLLHRSN